MGGSDSHYNDLETEDIYSLPVEGILKEDAHLWLWGTEEALRNGWLVECCRKWGFEDKALWPWTKLTKNPLSKKQLKMYRNREWPIIEYKGKLHGLVWANGYYSRVTNEYLLLGIRGDNITIHDERQRHRQIIAPWTGEHSEKPEDSYRLIENYSPNDAIELFAREQHSSKWKVWGKQAEGSNIIQPHGFSGWERNIAEKYYE